MPQKPYARRRQKKRRRRKLARWRLERAPMVPANLTQFAAQLSASLNTIVFPEIARAVLATPSLRSTLCPAFPFPRKLRIGALDSHLVVEYMGPEDPESDSFETEATWQPGMSVLEFFGIDVSHLKVPRMPYSRHVENLQVFLGEAMSLLGDYLYDLVLNPNDVMLNGFPDFSQTTAPIYLSNVSFLWSDDAGALRIRRIDFAEIIPVQVGGWPHHTDESLTRFAEFLVSYRVPRYEIELHQVLNRFIELASSTDGVDEPTITRYLADNPEILQLAFGANRLNPEVLLEWQYESEQDDLKPDFLPEKMDGFSDVLEFKLPRLKSGPMVGSEPRRHPSYEVDAALAQIDAYAEWCSQEVNRRWLKETHGIHVLHPHTYLVIGHRSDFSAAERQKLRGRRNATIFTYDEFVEMARMRLYSIR